MRQHAWLILGLLALCLTASAQSPSGVVINEFQYDDSGIDDREFVELYNGGPNPVNIGGWTVMCSDLITGDNNPDYVITPGTILNPGQFYVLGSPLVPNVNQVIGTSPTFQNLLENDNEVIALIDTFGLVHDTVGYEMNKTNPAFFPINFVEGQGIWGNHQSIDNFNLTWSRWIDGLDTDSNGRDFGNLPGTPGTSNVPANNITYLENFDGLTVNSDVGGMIGSFFNPRVSDPTVADGQNPTVIPPSPQGGNCMTFWDPAGGGNTAFLVTSPASNFLLECYVYIRTGNICPDFETWSIGVRGTTDGFHNHPLPNSGNPPCANTTITETNGQTGVCWHLSADLLGNVLLYLLDENDGGPDHKVLATIPITPGVNDGWQRLRLEVADDVVVGNFGGVYGDSTTGVRVQALLDSPSQIGTVYFGFREFLVNNANVRPLTIDDLLISNATQPYTVFFHQAGPGAGITVENRGTNLGLETFNLVSVIPCPMGVGSGPYLGLCSFDPLTDFIPQVTAPLGTPFHFIGPGGAQSFGPFNGIIPNLTIEIVSFELNFGLFGNISQVFRYTTI